MYWEKEIRFKLTTRRIFSGIIAAMSVLNLTVVGAVFNASSQSTPETETAFMTSTPPQETLTGVFPTDTLAMISLIPEFTSVIIHTASPTLISTFTPTDTSTAVPAATTCARRSYWPVYRVQRGDILTAIAQATGSTVRELIEANCLPDTRIYAGQILYVPRLPIHPFTPTLTPSFTSTIIPSFTPTDTPSPTQTGTPTATPTYTPTSTPSNTPTIFKNPDAIFWMCPDPDSRISLMVTPYDPEGIRSVIALYNINNGSPNEVSMGPDGATYYGSEKVPGNYAKDDQIKYSFRVYDDLGIETESETYTVAPRPCP